MICLLHPKEIDSATLKQFHKLIDEQSFVQEKQLERFKINNVFFDMDLALIDIQKRNIQFSQNFNRHVVILMNQSTQHLYKVIDEKIGALLYLFEDISLVILATNHQYIFFQTESLRHQYRKYNISILTSQQIPEIKQLFSSHISASRFLHQHMFNSYIYFLSCTFINQKVVQKKIEELAKQIAARLALTTYRDLEYFIIKILNVSRLDFSRSSTGEFAQSSSFKLHLSNLDSRFRAATNNSEKLIIRTQFEQIVRVVSGICSAWEEAFKGGYEDLIYDQSSFAIQVRIGNVTRRPSIISATSVMTKAGFQGEKSIIQEVSVRSELDVSDMQ